MYDEANGIEHIPKYIKLLLPEFFQRFRICRVWITFSSSLFFVQA